MSLSAFTVAPISVVQLKHNNSFGVDKLVHPGVCDTPLHWLFAVFNIIFRKPILFYYKQGLKSICMGREAGIACIFP